MLPQITRLTTGMAPDDPHFIAEWEALLRALGDRLAPVGPEGVHDCRREPPGLITAER